MTPKRLFQLLKETAHQWSQDKVPRLGAALAYYSVFSLAPLLIIVISLAGIVLGKDAAQGQIRDQIRNTVGDQAAEAIEKTIQQTSQSDGMTLAAVVGIVILIFGASAVFAQLQDALNSIWKVKPKPGLCIAGVIKDRLLSIAVVFSTGFLMVVSLCISATLSALGKVLADAGLHGSPALWQLIEGVMSFAFVTVLFAMIYKILPDVEIAWRYVWRGAALSSFLFSIGKYFIGLYLGRTNATSAFGASGSLVVILIWVYYSSQILLFGAEFTYVDMKQSGSAIVPNEKATRTALLGRGSPTPPE